MTNLGMLESRGVPKTIKYEPGDYIKVEFKDDRSGESEWMWVIVENSDDSQRIVFGVLDSMPLVHADRLAFGQKLAISYDNIRDHRKPDEFVRL